MLQITAGDTPDGQADGHSVLLNRRHRYTRKLSFYRCWTSGPVPLGRLIAVAQARWRIEEDHQLARQVAGLDPGQVIQWRSWHRWSTICLLTYIYLAVTCHAIGAGPVSDPELIPVTVTVPELLRLLPRLWFDFQFGFGLGAESVQGLFHVALPGVPFRIQEGVQVMPRLFCVHPGRAGGIVCFLVLRGPLRCRVETPERLIPLACGLLFFLGGLDPSPEFACGAQIRGVVRWVAGPGCSTLEWPHLLL